MKLLHNTILLGDFKPLEPLSTTLALPEDRFERVGVITGTILEVGTEVKDTDIEVGLRVLVPNHFGTEISKGQRVFNYEDILGIVEGQ